MRNAGHESADQRRFAVGPTGSDGRSWRVNIRVSGPTDNIITPFRPAPREILSDISAQVRNGAARPFEKIPRVRW